MLTYLLQMLKGQRKYSDIYHFLLGNYRYKIYYSTKPWVRKWLMRKHILEQIDFRIKWMDPECYMNGQCKICGCQTTALQMANKACDKPCYPPMMDKRDWNQFISRRTGIDNLGYWWRIGTNTIKLVKKIEL